MLTFYFCVRGLLLHQSILLVPTLCYRISKIDLDGPALTEPLVSLVP